MIVKKKTFKKKGRKSLHILPLSLYSHHHIIHRDYISLFPHLPFACFLTLLYMVTLDQTKTDTELRSWILAAFFLALSLMLAAVCFLPLLLVCLMPSCLALLPCMYVYVPCSPYMPCMYVCPCLYALMPCMYLVCVPCLPSCFLVAFLVCVTFFFFLYNLVLYVCTCIPCTFSSRIIQSGSIHSDPSPPPIHTCITCKNAPCLPCNTKRKEKDPRTHREGRGRRREGRTWRIG